MTKEKYIDELTTYVKRLDNTMQVHPQLVEVAINGAVNSILSMIYEANPMDVGVYTKTYENVAITASKAYITDDLTSSGDDIPLVQLPRIGGGVMNIRPSEDVDIMFFPMRIQDKAMHQRMHSTEFNTDVGYVVRGNTIEIVGDTTVDTVDVDVVRAFEAYDYDETFYMPFERHEEVKNMVLQKLGIPQPVSLINNNSDELNRG